MRSLRNIWAIMKFESKVIWRSWFFRIYALLQLGMISIFSLVAFSPVGETEWYLYSNSWGIPYANMMMLNLGQAAAVIFLATGLMKVNKKLDTNEVFYVRPISNFDLVMGKALALIKLFFWLNVAVAVIGIIYNLTNPLAPFNLIGYIYYPLLMSVPSVLFIMGLSFLLVTVLRNQPISIILLLGYSGTVLIYFFEKYNNIFDYMNFRLPMHASDITGFSGLDEILLQRSFYVIAGLSFLLATAYFSNRLPSKRIGKYVVGVASVFGLVAATFVMIELWDNHLGRYEYREKLMAINGEWSGKPNVDIQKHHMELTHMGNEISVKSTLQVFNDEEASLDTIYFTLNPGLIADGIEIDGIAIDHQREEHLVSVIRPGGFPQGGLTFEIQYHGSVDEAVAFLDVRQERFEEHDPSFIWSVAERYAYLQPEFVLLTKDLMWYPDTRIGYSRTSSVTNIASFVDFSMDIRVADGYTPVTQGSYSVSDDSLTHQFRNEVALPQVSLAIGKFDTKTITVEGIDFSIHHHPDNDYFSEYFELLPDTLPLLITDLKNGYEHEQQLKYPFRHLKFVEVPTHFYAYNRIYETNQAYVQPEMVFWPEKGGDIREMDFKRQFKRMDEQAKEQNQVLGDKEKQANVFTDMVKKVFTKQESNRWFFDGRNTDEANYSLFPNLYTYNVGIVSEEWPLLNKGIHDYLNRTGNGGYDYSRNLEGISFTEQCNELMSKSNLMDILTTEEEFRRIQKSVQLKSEYLFSYIDRMVGGQAFKTFLYDWIDGRQHELTTYRDFRRAVFEKFSVDIDPIIRATYFETSQPAYVITNNQTYEIINNDRKQYQVLFDVKNAGDSPGVIKISFDAEGEYEGWGFFRKRNEDVETTDDAYLSLLDIGQSKRYGFVLNSKPEDVLINTLVSSNIPSVVYYSPGKVVLRENVTPFQGERVIEVEKQEDVYEVIVDNEDPGFSTFSPIKDTYLKAYLDSRQEEEKKFYGRWRRSSSKWLATTGSYFYGNSIRSAHFTRSGNGEKTTTWTPNLEEPGFYDIYVYMVGKNQNEGRRNDGKYTYQYIVNHGDGQDNITFNLSNAENGWNYLGSYYFSGGDESVVLTDRCDLRTVYADAVKWVKQ